MPITSSHLDPRAMIIPVWMGSLGPLKHFNIASSNKMYNAGNFDADLMYQYILLFSGQSSESTKASSPSFSLGIKPAQPKKYVTPSRGSYKPEESEKYLEEKIQHSMGIKPADPKKYITPAPGAYNSEEGEKYLEEK